jgi:hypothetical protein
LHAQGGDPTATGSGGKSAWGSAFADEVHPLLKHDKRGVLSMANSGPNSNGSQFFITFAPKPSLDGKHTVNADIVAHSNIVTIGARRRCSAASWAGWTLWRRPSSSHAAPKTCAVSCLILQPLLRINCPLFPRFRSPTS